MKEHEESAAIPNDLVQREVAAGAVGVSLRTLDGAVANGALESFAQGGRTLVSLSAAKEWRAARIRPHRPLRDVQFDKADVEGAFRRAELTFKAANGGVVATEDFAVVFEAARAALPEAGIGFYDRKARALALSTAEKIAELSGVGLADALEFVVSGTLPGRTGTE